MKVVSALVFLAMAAYLAVYIANRFSDPVQTALAVTATMSDSSTMSGLVIRDEVLVKSGAEYIDVVVDDGEKVSVGQTVAVIYGSEDALQSAVRMDSLAREISGVSAALSAAGGEYTGGNRETSIYDALIGLSTSLRSDGMAGIDTRQSTLASLVFRREVSDATEDYLLELQNEYRDLAASAAADTQSIEATESGTFSSLLDGYEGVDPEYAKTLGPDDLREVIAADRTVDEDAIGKLILSYDWYYAAIVSREDAERLVAGRSVELSFGRYYSEELKADVVYVGQADGDEQLVLFRVDKAFEDMLAVRAVSAELIYSEYTGLRVPLKGLYRYYAGYMEDEDGASLTEGETVTLTLGGEEYAATVSEVGFSQRYGELPYGVEPGGEFDQRPTHRQVVFCWPWDDGPAPDLSEGGATVTPLNGREPMSVVSYYEYDPENPDVDRLCVFTMTGLQAERKKVDLIYAGEEYCLLSSQGSDALREGNKVIVQANNLHDGKVFR